MQGNNGYYEADSEFNCNLEFGITSRNILWPEVMYELPGASPSPKSIEREGRDVAVIIVLMIVVGDIKSVPRRARARSVGFRGQSN